MCHKWSAPGLLNTILNTYLDTPEDAPQYKAAQEYLKRKREKRLPEPRDPQHKVAQFVDMGYGPSRFKL